MFSGSHNICWERRSECLVFTYVFVRLPALHLRFAMSLYVLTTVFGKPKTANHERYVCCTCGLMCYFFLVDKTFGAKF